MLDPAHLTARRIRLPEDGHAFVIGGADLPLGNTAASVRLFMRRGQCLVLDASEDVEINRSLPSRPSALHHGDLISVGETELVFGYFDEHRSQALEAEIARRPDADETWAVYADWLQEQGDPLGDRLANPTVATDDFWLEALDAVEVKWAHGMIAEAVFRESLGGFLGSARKQLTHLLSLRASLFLRRLSLDLLADEQALTPSAIVNRVEALLKQLPPMPALEQLTVGYQLVDGELPASIALKDARFPKLRSSPVFQFARAGVFESVDGSTIAAAGTRISVFGERVTISRIGEGAGTASCSFDDVGGRVLMQVGEGREHTVEVNGFPWGMSVFLLPDDTLEIFPEPRGSLRPLKLKFRLV